MNESPTIESAKNSFQFTRSEWDIFVLLHLCDNCRVWLLGLFLPNDLPIAQDWAFLASFPAGLPQILNDHVMVAESIFAITIAQQRDVDVFPFFSVMNCGFIDFHHIQLNSDYVAHFFIF
jgi:hypothetical protein